MTSSGLPEEQSDQHIYTEGEHDDATPQGWNVLENIGLQDRADDVCEALHQKP